LLLGDFSIGFILCPNIRKRQHYAEQGEAALIEYLNQLCLHSLPVPDRQAPSLADVAAQPLSGASVAARWLGSACSDSI